MDLKQSAFAALIADNEKIIATRTKEFKQLTGKILNVHEPEVRLAAMTFHERSDLAQLNGLQVFLTVIDGISFVLGTASIMYALEKGDGRARVWDGTGAKQVIAPVVVDRFNDRTHSGSLLLVLVFGRGGAGEDEVPHLIGITDLADLGRLMGRVSFPAIEDFNKRAALAKTIVTYTASDFIAYSNAGL